MKVRVRSGDSIWYFSQLFVIPLPLILDSNQEVTPSQLSVGQLIQLPGYVITSYTIQKGDSFWSISQNLNLPIDAILLLNQNMNPNTLQIGARMTIPVRVTWRVVNGKDLYDYETMVKDIKQLITIYPFIRMQSIGKSVMGKSIPELKIGSGDERVHVNGSFHSNEWITTPVIMQFLNDYLLAITNGTPIRGIFLRPYYNKVLSSVPMVNPDGVNLVINGPPNEEPYLSQVLKINNGSTDFSGWKANIRGVDLNNQFPAEWEIEQERKEQQPAPKNYPGPFPLSEPESQAMANLTEISDFSRVLAFHTQGEVIYWGYQGLEPPEARTIVNEFAQVSGYLPIQTVDSYAGYKDWFIQEWQRPGYTLELGKGTSPLPLNQFDEIYEESLGILLANLYISY